MLKVLLPSTNKLNGGYSPSHRGYDHDDVPDKNYYASFYGKVVQAKNSETRNWIANTSTDPYRKYDEQGKPVKRDLTTADFGNYIKIKGEIDGKVVYQIGAHLQTNTVLPVGTEVKAGQSVGQIGNTGNSTGDHCHTEYRDSDENRLEVEFVKHAEPTTPIDEVEKLPKDNVIRDFYAVLKEDDFNDDEIKRWMQENKNLREIFTSVMEGDGSVKRIWLENWGIDTTTDKQTVINELTETQNKIKDTLRPVGYKSGSTTEEMLGLLAGLISELQELRKQTKPTVIYRSEGKEFESVLKFGNMKLIIEKGGDV